MIIDGLYGPVGLDGAWKTAQQPLLRHAFSGYACCLFCYCIMRMKVRVPQGASPDRLGWRYSVESVEPTELLRTFTISHT